jgi:hypothetical protein
MAALLVRLVGAQRVEQAAARGVPLCYLAQVVELVVTLDTVKKHVSHLLG